MTIGGFQKFSLLDYPGHLAAIIFTQGCNFRCSYCHNPELVNPKLFSKPIAEAEVMDFLSTRRGKLGAVCITGGEPCLQPDLIDFLWRLKALGFLTKLDTNGMFPKVLEQIAEANLVDYWAMDIKAPLALYKVITKRDVDAPKILHSMEILRSSGKEYEFRTTFFDSLLNWGDIDQIRSLLKPGDRYYLQQCRYEKTLDGLDAPKSIAMEDDGQAFFHLLEHPACQDLLAWGGKNHINVGIRSL